MNVSSLHKHAISDWEHSVGVFETQVVAQAGAVAWAWTVMMMDVRARVSLREVSGEHIMWMVGVVFGNLRSQLGRWRRF